mgnify:CR=1 FL=1
MKTLFDRVQEKGAQVVAPLKQFPLLYRGLGVVLALALYTATLVAVEALAGSVFLVVVTALYFLPAVLRAWLLFYWQVRADVKGWQLRRAAPR